MEKQLCASFFVFAVKLRDFLENKLAIIDRQGKALIFNSKIDDAISNLIRIVVPGPLLQEKPH